MKQLQKHLQLRKEPFPNQRTTALKFAALKAAGLLKGVPSTAYQLHCPHKSTTCSVQEEVKR